MLLIRGLIFGEGGLVFGGAYIRDFTVCYVTERHQFLEYQC